MRTFTDTTGKEWHLDVNIGTVERVRDELSIDLLRPEQGEPTLLDRLADDPLLLAQIICTMLDDVTEADIKKAWKGATVAAARKAFFEELIDFFRQSGRTDRALAIEKHAQAFEIAVETVRQRIDKLEIQAMIRGAISGNSPE